MCASDRTFISISVRFVSLYCPLVLEFNTVTLTSTYPESGEFEMIEDFSNLTWNKLIVKQIKSIHLVFSSGGPHVTFLVYFASIELTVKLDPIKCFTLLYC